jgi:hypothetical protein
MAVKFAGWGNHQFVIPTTGAPASGYKLWTYVAGSATLVTTYTTSAGSVAQSNPIVLNSAGFPTTGQIWVTEGTSTKIVFTDASDVVIKTEDNIPGVNDAALTADEWVSGPTPTFVSTTSFTLVGDQTTTFHVGRRVKTTNSGGTIYSRISATAYTTLTTVTVVNDSGVLDSGLSAVSYGLLSATNFTLPQLTQANKRLIDLPGLADDNIWTGTQTMSGKSFIDDNASIAAHATTMNPWSSGNYVTCTGSAVTFTAMTAAPQAGAEVELYMNAAHVWTDGAVFEVDGDATWTAEAGDRVLLRAKSTTVFTVHPRKKTGIPLIAPTASQGASKVLISVTAISTSSFQITSGINSTYDDYELVIPNLTFATNTNYLTMTVFTAGPTEQTGANNYSYSHIDKSAIVAVGGDGSDGATNIALNNNAAGLQFSNNSTRAASFVIRFFNPAGTATNKRFLWHGCYETDSDTFVVVDGAGLYNGSQAAIVGIKITAGAGGNMTGAAYLYGNKYA